MGWDQRLADCFVQVPTPRHRATRLGWAKTRMAGVLRHVMTRYDAHAWLGAYPMTLLEAEGFRALLGPLPDAPTLLDIGAGPGEVHACLAPIFAKTVALETSLAAVRRATLRGFDARAIDLSETRWASAERFDVVALLNVLDRTARPITLLHHALETAQRNGLLLLAVPLPFRPHIEARGGTADPDEWLSLDGEDFDAALGQLCAWLEDSYPLCLERWTRTPYLSAGDAERPEFAWDDALLVLRIT